jgi:hypothetical protein
MEPSQRKVICSVEKLSHLSNDPIALGFRQVTHSLGYAFCQIKI